MHEREDVVGGNAGSFEIEGVRVDFGSHRLHPASDESVLTRIRDLLGDDLLERPRHGRIRLLGRWVHFPLRPLDMALRVPPQFATGIGFDLVRKLLPSGKAAETESFASVLERDLGSTICRDFYFPYCRKIWGLEPEEISPIQAYKRVSARSIGKLVRRLLPSSTSGSKKIFYYPRRGFGQICERMHEAAADAGAKFEFGSTVRKVRGEAGNFELVLESDGQERAQIAEHVWSTIPASVLARTLDPSLPNEVLDAARALKQRALVLVYLVLEQGRFTEYDAHYFPEAAIPMTRLSEPKIYAGREAPSGHTVLCAEIPCSHEDDVWSMDNDGLRDVVVEGLARAGLRPQSAILDVQARRLPNAYPIYAHGYERHFETLDQALDGIDGLLTFGRQGLFVHDNTHHALFMAQAAVDCIDDSGRVDRDSWAGYRKIFESHVVED